MSRVKNYNKYLLENWTFSEMNREKIISSVLSNEDIMDHYEDNLYYIKSRIKTILNKFETENDSMAVSRVLFLKEGESVNENDIGIYWTNMTIDHYHVEEIAEQIGKDLDEHDVYVVDASINKIDIDFVETVIANINFPDENEINLIEGRKPTEYNIREYKI